MATSGQVGSKSGIHGAIAPISREHCDFGKGFYMGTDRTQPLTLICNYPKARLYTLNVDLSGLKILDIEVGLDWALLAAYNRGKMETVKHSTIYSRIEDLSKGCDMMSGYIANDRMFVVLDRFFNGEITDLALVNSLSALKLEELDDEIGGLKKAGTVYSGEVMYWAGYTYRYWHYYTGEFSREIYKIADAKTMNECWLGFHTSLYRIEKY